MCTPLRGLMATVLTKVFSAELKRLPVVVNYFWICVLGDAIIPGNHPLEINLPSVNGFWLMLQPTGKRDPNFEQSAVRIMTYLPSSRFQTLLLGTCCTIY